MLLLFFLLLRTCHRISSGRENKDERCTGIGIYIAFGEVKWRRLHELTTKLVFHKISNKRYNLKRHHFINQFDMRAKTNHVKTVKL